MANGRLARAVISSANTNTLVYTVPAGVYSPVNICVVNSNGMPVTIRIAISTQSGNAPLSSEYIEYGVQVPGINGVLERTAVICSTGEKIIVWASTANAITVRVTGYEENI